MILVINIVISVCITNKFELIIRAPPWPNIGPHIYSPVVGHTSIAHGFKSRPSYVTNVFHLSLRLITFGSRSARVAYLVHNTGCKTAKFTLYINFELTTICLINYTAGYPHMFNVNTQRVMTLHILV